MVEHAAANGQPTNHGGEHERGNERDQECDDDRLQVLEASPPGWTRQYATGEDAGQFP